MSAQRFRASKKAVEVMDESQAGKFTIPTGQVLGGHGKSGRPVRYVKGGPAVRRDAMRGCRDSSLA